MQRNPQEVMCLVNFTHGLSASGTELCVKLPSSTPSCFWRTAGAKLRNRQKKKNVGRDFGTFLRNMLGHRENDRRPMIYGVGPFRLLRNICQPYWLTRW